MKLIEQCTTIEQSNKLVELGFDKETASLNWWLVSQLKEGHEDYLTPNPIGKDTSYNIPCWTVGDMLDIIFNNLQEVYDEECNSYQWVDVNVSDNNCFVCLNNVTNCDNKDFVKHSLLRDNLFECLVWLKENKYL